MEGRTKQSRLPVSDLGGVRLVWWRRDCFALPNGRWLAMVLLALEEAPRQMLLMETFCVARPGGSPSRRP